MAKSKSSLGGLNAKPARLWATTDNPIPDRARVGSVHTSDGVNIRYARWEAELRPSKGTVILLHGRTEFIEKHFENIQDLRARGFGVLTFDWRGQGGSSRMLKDPRKGHVSDFNQYLIDLETIMTEVALPDCRPPFYILGHSTGALVALLAAPALSNRIRRMVLVSPLLQINKLPVKQSVVQRLMGVLTFLGLGRLAAVRRKKTSVRKFISNKLTSDTHRFQRTREVLEKNETLGIGPPTVAWVFAACRAMEHANLPGYSNTISVPTLFIAGGSDLVISPSAVEKYGRNMRSGAFLTISGAKHEILDERDVYREQFLAAFDAFVPGTEV